MLPKFEICGNKHQLEHQPEHQPEHIDMSDSFRARARPGATLGARPGRGLGAAWARPGRGLGEALGETGQTGNGDEAGGGTRLVGVPK